MAKVYWTAVPRSALQRGIELMIEAGESGFFGTDSVDDLPFVLDDELVTTGVDGRPYLPAKMAAMRAHASQISAGRPVLLAGREGRRRGVRASSTSGWSAAGAGPADGPDGRETDLFAGLT